MGCCFSKKKDKNKQQKLRATVSNGSMEQEKIEANNSSNDKPKVEPFPQHAKMWMQQSPSKIQQQKQKEQQNIAQPQSKRRQLLKNLFDQAKRSKNQNNSPHVRLQRAQTIESGDSNSSQKSNLTMNLQQAIGQLIKNNKQQLTSCSICTQSYSDSRPPMMVCLNQHTFCLQCIQDLWKKGYKKCPLDQNTYEINNIQKNRFILSIVNKISAEQ